LVHDGTIALHSSTVSRILLESIIGIHVIHGWLLLVHDGTIDLMALPANQKCADCGKKDPNWASINLGIFICLSCSGIHRSLGTHITKVRSCTLDTWEPQQIEVMKSVGNARAKEIWEARVPNDYPIPKETDSQNTIKKWIVAKYENQEFKAKDNVPKRPSVDKPAPSQQTKASPPIGNYNNMSPTYGNNPGMPQAQFGFSSQGRGMQVNSPVMNQQQPPVNNMNPNYGFQQNSGYGRGMQGNSPVMNQQQPMMGFANQQPPMNNMGQQPSYGVQNQGNQPQNMNQQPMMQQQNRQQSQQQPTQQKPDDLMFF